MFKLDQAIQVSKLTEASPSMDHVYFLGEILLVLSALSTKRDCYFSQLSQCDEHLKAYYDIIAKYVTLSSDPEAVLRHTLAIERKRRTTILHNQIAGAIEKERFKLLMQIDTLEKAVENLQTQNRELTDTLIDVEEKYQDLKKDNDIMYEQHRNVKVSAYSQREIDEIEDSLNTLHLQNELHKNQVELEELKKTHEGEIKVMKGEIRQLIEDKVILEDKYTKLSNLQHENEQLKIRIKELQINKDKLLELDSLKEKVEKKNSTIAGLLKEKSAIMTQSQTLMKENLEEKTKLKEIEMEYKRLESDFKDFKREAEVRAFGAARKQTKSNVLNLNDDSTPTLLGQSTGGFQLDKLHITMNDIEGKEVDTAEDGNVSQPQVNIVQPEVRTTIPPIIPIVSPSPEEDEYYKQAQVLRTELNDMKAVYQNEMNVNKNLLDELSQMKVFNQEITFELEKALHEKEDLLNEHEKIEVQKQRLELECDQYSLELEKHENQKKKLTEEIFRFKEKLDYITKEKAEKTKEIDTMKVTMSKKNIQIEKIMKEKQMLVNDLQNLQKNYKNRASLPSTLPSAPKTLNMESKTNSEKTAKGPLESNEKSRTTSNSINHDLGSSSDAKAEKFKMKAAIVSKDETIKQLKERIKHLEKIEQAMKLNLKEDNSQMYKKSYEDQQMLINQEHEMLTNNLYDLARQFVSYKNELLKNVRPNVLQSNNLDG